MFRHTTNVTALVLGLAGSANAATCALVGDDTISEIDALNAMILAKDFDAFSAEIDRYLGLDVSSSIAQIAAVFTEDFTDCTTIAIRRDVGGMVQSIVEFNSPLGPLFGYWLSSERDGAFNFLSFNLNTDLNVVLQSLH